MSRESILASRLAIALLVLPIANSACSGSTFGRDIFSVSGAVSGVIRQGSVPLPDAAVVATALYPPPNGALRLK
jgi:hypothetical protein